ncbi:PDC sensor domain-containing protein [Azohydromonas lata]|uniref:Uncharacterized protein n=1 Tax=Azohydromonas lata TaxID=45677 RepID=A0ABU5I868_9BURK|nr:hypothetical protein [Azohydromonas lata]MDZ5455290.1 hypothetical protein [Azohydromonas lata]
MVLLSATALALLWRSRDDALATWEQFLGSFSAAVAGHATQTLQSADAVLKNVMEQVKVHGPDSEEALRRLSISTPFQDLLRDRAARHPAIGFVAVADVEGRILSASLPMPTLDEPSQMRVRAFIADSARDVDLLIPPRGCTAGSEAFCLVRKIRTASGRVIGLALAGIETRHFKRFYRSVSLGHGDSAILLLSRDASLLARHPPRPEALGLPYGGEPSVQAAAKAWAEGRSAAVVRMQESAHGTPQMSAVYAVTGFPLMASVSASDSLVLASWRRMAWFVSVGTVLVDLLIAAMALHAHRLKVQRRTALRQLDAARAEAESASQVLAAVRKRVYSVVRSRFSAVSTRFCGGHLRAGWASAVRGGSVAAMGCRGLGRRAAEAAAVLVKAGAMSERQSCAAR